MKKKLVYLLGLFLLIIIGFIVAFIIWVFTSSPEAINRNKFENEFDLQLKGKILNVSLNKYGQTLVCLKVLKSNHKNYFLINDPNVGNEEKDFWEKRFFIKVEDSLAVFICENKAASSIHETLKENSYVVINRNNDKTFEVFENENTEEETNIGLKIITYPIRDNLEKSCLNKQID